MMLRRFSHLLERRRMKVLFLASHGLRTHLSALRWAASRLRKSSTTLTAEQKHLIGEIHDQTSALTAAFQSMLILGQFEEGEYSPQLSPLSLTTQLQALYNESAGREILWNISPSKNVKIISDQHILSAIFTDISILCMEAVSFPQTIYISVQAQEKWVFVQIYAHWNLPFLDSTVGADRTEILTKSLGGTPGLMLSLASELAKLISATVTLEEVASEEEDLVSDGTVERRVDAFGEHRIVLRFPRPIN